MRARDPRGRTGAMKRAGRVALCLVASQLRIYERDSWFKTRSLFLSFSFSFSRRSIDEDSASPIVSDSQVRARARLCRSRALVRLRRPIDREQFLDCVSGNEKNSRPYLPRTHVKRSTLAKREEETVQLRVTGRTITRFDY